MFIQMTIKPGEANQEFRDRVYAAVYDYLTPCSNSPQPFIVSFRQQGCAGVPRDIIETVACRYPVPHIAPHQIGNDYFVPTQEAIALHGAIFGN